MIYKNIIVVLVLLSSSSCEKGDKAIEVVTDNIERGAILRTIVIENNTFDINTLENIFSVTLEEQDLEDGFLMETVDVYVQFRDNTTDIQDVSTSLILIESIPSSEWDFSGNLPRNTLDYSFEELLEVTGMELNQVASKDQFILSLSLNLKDGRTFDSSNASSIIIAFDTFFSSPFLYTITLVEPVSNDLFTGLYSVNSILNGPNGPTFVDEFRVPLQENAIVEVVAGTSINTREFRAYHNLHHTGLEAPRRWEFVITDDVTIMGKNQLSSPEGWCIRNAAPTLLGPDSVNGFSDSTDDSVFELWFVEGYLGFDGGCGYGTVPSRYKFSKQ